MKLTIIAAIAIVVAPVAQAQTVCEEVSRINASGLYRFDSIKGTLASDEADDELYESNATLFGAGDCLIDQYFEPAHVCTWEFDTEADLMAAYHAKTAAIAPCFDGWAREGLLVSDPAEPYRVLAGVGYLGADAYETVVWEIVADFDQGRATGRYRLEMKAIDYT